MFVSESTHTLPIADEWRGAFRLDTSPAVSARDAFVPALPHSLGAVMQSTDEPTSETERHLRRSYATLHKLRAAVSL